MEENCVPVFDITESVKPKTRSTSDSDMDKVVEFPDYQKTYNNGKCSLCQQYFTEAVRVPRRYPCFHVFCEKCIEDLKVDKHVVCPMRMCKQQFSLESRIHDNFPLDNCALAIASKLSVEREPESVDCKGCPEKARAQNFCKDCQYCLCTNCTNAHRRDLASRDHKTIDLTEVKNIKEMDIFCATPKCNTHDGKLKNYFCNSKDCKEPICHECLFDHPKQEHDVKKVKDAFPEFKENIGCCVTDLTERYKQVENGIKNVNEEIEAVIQQKTDVISGITATYNNYKAILERQQSSVCKKATDMLNVKNNVLEAHDQELKELEMRMKTLMFYTDVSGKFVNPAVFLQEAHKIKKQLEQVLQIDFQTTPKAKANLKYEQHRMSLDFIRYSKTLGSLQNDMTQAEKEISGSSTMIEEENAEATIVTEEFDPAMNEMQMKICMLENTVKELTDQCLQKALDHNSLDKIHQEDVERIKGLEERLAGYQKDGNQEGPTVSSVMDLPSITPPVAVKDDKQQEDNLMLAKMCNDIGKQPECGLIREKYRGPEKVAQAVRDLYDTTWTDTFEMMCVDGKDEKDVISILLCILKDCYTVCREFRSQISPKVEYLLDSVSKAEPSGTTNAAACGPTFTEEVVLQACLDRQLDAFNTVHKDIKYESMIAYIAECAQVCWAMNLHTPPIELLISAGGDFNAHLFREYTKKGPYVSYNVWPALVQFQYPRLLARGFAQGEKKKN